MDVSVIIPTYNRLWSLPQAIESCRHTLCQTEIIVIDDGSTDETWEWLQAQPNLVIERQNNWGKCWAVNRGFAVAKGEYVRFLDSDDWLRPGAIDAQFAIAKAQNADVVVGGNAIYADERTMLHEYDWPECDDFIAQQLCECGTSHYSAYLFRRQFIQDIPHRPDFAWRDDRLFLIEVAMKHPQVAIYFPPVLCHRDHDRERLQFSQGLKAAATNLQHVTLYQKCVNQLVAAGEFTPRRCQAVCNVMWMVAHWIAYTDLEEACAVAQWVYTLNPEYHPYNPGWLGKLYSRIGFRHTERLLLLRRNLLKLFGAK
jgi:glycosyltransferase involved in cell wall biosynthesis